MEVHKMKTEDEPGLATLNLPYNLEAEQGLLGSLLVDNKGLDDVADIISADDFYAPAHVRIYSAINEMLDRGQAVSPVTLKNKFDRDGDLEHIGGGAYLTDLAACVVSFVNNKSYARQIRDLSLRRQVACIMAESCHKAKDISPYEDATADDLISDIEQQLFDLAEKGMTGGPLPVSETMGETLQYIENAQKGIQVGLSTGIAALDERINGLMNGELVVIAGRPSMGKTVMGMTLAHNVARRGAQSLVFSFEMSAPQLNMRMLARETGIGTDRQLKTKGLTDVEFRRVFDAKITLDKLPMMIDDSAGLTVPQIKARARRHKRRYGLDLIVIDQLTHVKPPTGVINPVQQISEITRGLKQMARDLNLPVVLMHQLNRSVEQRENKRPQLSDLRDSGAIEQDADVVIFLYREEYYLERAGKPEQREKETPEQFADRESHWHAKMNVARGKGEAIVSKIRMGKCGAAHLAFNGERQCFSDLDLADREG